MCLISACASKPSNTIIYYPTEDAGRNAQNKLAETALSVSDSLNQLAAIEKATHPKAKLPPPVNPDRIGLGTLTSVDWTGPVEPLVQKLAHASHYKFRVIGKNPAIPVIVAVYATNMTIADILRDADLQAGQKADVVIYPNHRIIELRYRHF